MRIAFEGGTAGLLQTMHPAIGQGLIDHSDFFDDPVDRVFRSLPGILGTVYGGPTADATGIEVRDFHRDIKGVLPVGDRYHALHPDTFWWAHATFQRMVDRIASQWERYHLTIEDSARLYADGCEWYRRYGMSVGILPKDRAAFDQEFARVCAEVLAPNPASDRLIDFINRRSIPDMSASPHYPTHPRLRPLADLLLPTTAVRTALAPPMRLVIFGGLPPAVRDRFGIRWSRADDRRYRAIRAAVRTAWPYVPAALKWYPAARKGWLRESGHVPGRFPARV
ncbi:DUF2236 domain-containing protein [Mycolicibacterium sp. S2-37]|nr:DUF2236 domain-containing protein [Mycolicibacterium sp. S2-37]